MLGPDAAMNGFDRMGGSRTIRPGDEVHVARSRSEVARHGGAQKAKGSDETGLGRRRRGRGRPAPSQPPVGLPATGRPRTSAATGCLQGSAWRGASWSRARSVRRSRGADGSSPRFPSGCGDVPPADADKFARAVAVGGENGRPGRQGGVHGASTGLASMVDEADGRPRAPSSGPCPVAPGRSAKRRGSVGSPEAGNGRASSRSGASAPS